MLTLSAILVLPGTSCEDTEPEEGESTFTLVALPDTQKYSEDYPDVFVSQTSWIVDNAEAENIGFVTHLGDVVDNGPDLDQWANAREALQLLDDADIPYGVVMGNHDNQNSNDAYQYPEDVDTSCSNSTEDIDCTGAHYLEYAGPKYYEDRPWFGGASPSGLSHYSMVEHAGFTFMFLHTHADPRAAEITWAQEQIDAHPEALVHLSTHRYLYDYRIVDIMPDPLPLLTAGRFNDVILLAMGKDLYYTDSVTADELFIEFIATNSNIFMVQCGHVDAEYRQQSLNDAGLPVHELLVDYQTFHPDGGNGWMRLLRFDVENDRVEVETYSPWIDAYRENGAGLDASLEALEDALDKYGDDLEAFGLDMEELTAIVEYWTTTEEGRQEYYEAAYGDGSRDSRFVLEVDFEAYTTAQ